MCLILAKEAGAIIDYDKIETAVINNPDGWGYVIPIKDEAPAIGKHFDPDGTNPEHVLKFLEENKDEHVYLHLRFTTAGDTVLTNCHPFHVLDKKQDGYGMFMMHNGTLHEYKDTTASESDTYLFNNEFVSPLAERFAKFLGDEGPVLEDAVFCKIMSKFVHSPSKVLLIDEYNNKKIFGEKGTQYTDSKGKKWWVSNTYSFTKGYRKPKSKPKETKTYSGWRFDKDTNTWEEAKENLPINSFHDYTQNLSNTIPMDYANTYRDLGEKEKGYIVDQWGLTSLDDICQLDAKDINDLVINAPDDATSLILALQYALYEEGQA